MAFVRGSTIRRLLAEFLAIFAGVVLGLLADDWRQARVDRADGADALRLIAADLASDSAELAGRLDAVRADVEAASWLTRSWDRADAPADSTERALNRFYLTAYYQPSNATYESLKSGDRLHIIRDDGLRSRIVHYFQNRETLVAQAGDMGMDADFKTLAKLDRHVRRAAQRHRMVRPHRVVERRRALGHPR